MDYIAKKVCEQHCCKETDAVDYIVDKETRRYVETNAMGYTVDFTHCCMEPDVMNYIAQGETYCCMEPDTKGYIVQKSLITTLLHGD